MPNSPTLPSYKDLITLAHGAGGKAMSSLISELFLSHFDNTLPLEDQARIDIRALSQHGNRLAFTTDSYVVDPLFFKGGDIGMLAVNGTVNDLAVGGAVPLYLSCSFILEEGLPVNVLERIVESMQKAAEQAGVKIVTGDTKVVPRGAVDKIFINTSGVGVITDGVDWSVGKVKPGDAIVINNTVGDHGVAVLSARGDLGFDANVESDCRGLHRLCSHMGKHYNGVRAVRDATRGGVASALNEMAEASGVRIVVNENKVPVRQSVKSACDMLGLDPLYLANEGLMVVAVDAAQADSLVVAMHKIPGGEQACIIGQVTGVQKQGDVQVQTAYGTLRRLDLLHGDQLPRIC